MGDVPVTVAGGSTQFPPQEAGNYLRQHLGFKEVYEELVLDL